MAKGAAKRLSSKRVTRAAPAAKPAASAPKARAKKATPERTVTVHETKRVFDGFFKIDEAIVSYSKVAGKGMVQNVKRLVFERGDSAAALLHNIDRDTVVLTEQFRFPTYAKGPGWLLEPMAGSVAPNEEPAACIRREMMEELGYRAGAIKEIATFYVSPGGTSERIILFYAPVRDSDLVDPDASGVAAENEDIKRVEVKRKAFVEGCLAGRYQDAKLLIAGLWLAARHKK